MDLLENEIKPYSPEAHTRSERKFAYQIPERDKASATAPLIKGQRITFNQAVQRVGYETDWHSFDEETRETCALTIIKGLTARLDGDPLEIETIKRVVEAMNLRNPFRGINREVAKRLLSKKSGTLRAMWFWLPNEREHVGEILRKVRRVTGTYEASYQSNAYDEPTEQEPPSLSDTRTHTLYVVRDECCGRERLVHPADATLIQAA